jgi:membrane protein
MKNALNGVIARVTALRVVRVFIRYSERNGPILAGGLSLTALYSVFAAMYVGFAILGQYVQSDPAVKAAVETTLSSSVPGLIKSGGGGVVTVGQLFQPTVLSWSSIIALAALLVTTLSWFDSTRSAVRTVFGLPRDSTSFLALKLRDLGLVVGFGAVTIFSAAIAVFSTSALVFVFGVVGIDPHSVLATVVVRGIGLLLVLAIDTAVLAVLFRVLLDTQVPLNRLLTGSLLGGIALGILKVLGATIVGTVNRNPLLASFAVILGLLVWFGLVCQVILLSATWIAVDIADHGQSVKTTARESGIRPRGPHSRPRARPVGRLR